MSVSVCVHSPFANDYFLYYLQIFMFSVLFLADVFLKGLWCSSFVRKCINSESSKWNHKEQFFLPH